MADDTRKPSPPPHTPPEDLSRSALTLHPDHKSFSSAQWHDPPAQPYKPPANANLMPGGTQNTAGGGIPEVTWWNALQVGQPITELHRRPCVRDSFMTGIGAGFATGGLRAIFGATVWKSCNWAVGTFMLGSGVMYQYCLYRRQAEKEGMMRAVEILNKKELEKKAREQRKEQMREERRQAKEMEQEEKYAALRAKDRGGGGKPWWKVW